MVECDAWGSPGRVRGGGKIRILMVASAAVGGIRTYLKYVLPELDSARFDIRLVACRNSESLQLLSTLPARVRVRLVNSRAACMARIAGEIVLFRPHVVNSQGFTSAVLSALPCALLRRTHALTIHGIVEERYFRGRFAALRRMVWKCALRSTDVFIGVGRDILEHVKEHVDPGLKRKARWVLVRNGIRIDEFVLDRAEARRKLFDGLGLSSDTFLFGFFGRFMPQKGFDLIVEALSRLRDDPRAACMKVMAVGSGDYVRESKAWVRQAGLESRFVFLPRQASVERLIAGCDCVLMPSRWEAFSLLAVEALCAGTPLIASDCIGLREVVEDTPAIVVSSGDLEALLSAMIYVHGESAVTRQAWDFRATAHRRFDVKKTAHRLAKLFRDLASPCPLGFTETSDAKDYPLSGNDQDAITFQ